MEELFGGEWNSQLNKEEMEAVLKEFQQDYNQRHFVRNDTFRAAADKIEGPARKIFVEFLERSCTAEFSGFSPLQGARTPPEEDQPRGRRGVHAHVPRRGTPRRIPQQGAQRL